MIELVFLGAARTVTGSMHLLRTSRAQVLLDCGLFQGHRRESIERNRMLPVRAPELDAVVLSHAHIDHSGALPVLVKQGLTGAIHATPATCDLCELMLEDSGSIQESDARYVNKLVAQGHRDIEPVEPLYTTRDVPPTLARMRALPYHEPREIAPGVRLTFLDAGHVLGSAVCVLDVEDAGARKRIAFSGDLGRRHMAILRDYEIPREVDALICESTYGDRLHPAVTQMEEELAQALARTHARGGKVIIPSFALERAQEIIYALKRLKVAGRMPPMPVVVDSPLTVGITEVFRRHPDCYDADARAHLEAHDSPFDFEGLRYVVDVEESKVLTASDAPMVIIAGSGMCEAGRVLHHLKASIEDPRHTVIIVGFQAAHTLGRRLVERRSRVKIFGLERERRAEVVVLNGFSAHADQRGLIDFVESVHDAGPLEHVVLVHGEYQAQQTLRTRLEQQGVSGVLVPESGASLVLDG